jgi:hypothetical protein
VGERCRGNRRGVTARHLAAERLLHRRVARLAVTSRMLTKAAGRLFGRTACTAVRRNGWAASRIDAVRPCGWTASRIDAVRPCCSTPFGRAARRPRRRIASFGGFASHRFSVVRLDCLSAASPFGWTAGQPHAAFSTPLASPSHQWTSLSHRCPASLSHQWAFRFFVAPPVF